MNQATDNEKSARATILPGAVIALVTLVGVDFVCTTSLTMDRVHRTAFVAARAVSPGHGGILAHTPTLTWAAAALVILLLLGRLVVSMPVGTAGAALVTVPDNNSAALLLRRKTSISYHTGGLYGP